MCLASKKSLALLTHLDSLCECSPALQVTVYRRSHIIYHHAPLQNTRIHTHCTQSEVVQLLGGAGDPKLTAVVLALLAAVEDIAVTFRRTSQVLFISTYLSMDGSSYMCSCLSIYIHWYIHIHAHMHIHTRTYAYIHIHIRTSLTHTHAFSLPNSPILSPLCLRMYCGSTHTQTHTHLCLRMCCGSKHTHTHTHTRTHTMKPHYTNKYSLCEN